MLKSFIALAVIVADDFDHSSAADISNTQKGKNAIFTQKSAVVHLNLLVFDFLGFD